jgi:hypothetical protein
MIDLDGITSRGTCFLQLTFSKLVAIYLGQCFVEPPGSQIFVLTQFDRPLDRATASSSCA